MGPALAETPLIGNETETENRRRTEIGNESENAIGEGDDDIRESKTERKCDVCLERGSKYSCPGCRCRVCSVPCHTSHRRVCGLKMRSIAKRSLLAMTTEELHRDVQFLELVGDRVEETTSFTAAAAALKANLPVPAPKRVRLTPEEEREERERHEREGGGGGVGVGGVGGGSKMRLSPRCLRDAARNQGVTVIIAPTGSVRRQQNSTVLTSNKKGRLRWRLELFLHGSPHSSQPSQSSRSSPSSSPLGTAAPIRVIDPARNQSTLLSAVLASLLSVAASKAAAERAPDRAIEAEAAAAEAPSASGVEAVTAEASESINEEACELTSETIKVGKACESTYAALMRQVQGPANERGWLFLDLSRSLEDNLRGQAVVEFPTFHFVLSNLIQPAPLLLSPSSPSIAPPPPTAADGGTGQRELPSLLTAVGSFQGRPIYKGCVLRSERNDAGEHRGEERDSR